MELAVRRLGWSLKAIAFRIVQPAMIGTRDAAFLNATVTKRRAAMRAAVVNKPNPSGLIAEEHKRLTENTNQLRGILRCDLAGDGDRKPISPQQVARRSSRAHAGQHFIFFSSQHDRTSFDVCPAFRRR